MFKKIFAFFAMFAMLLVSTAAFADYERTADNTVSAYQDPGLTNRTGNERVDAGDRVIVHEETGNAYRVTYPTPRGSKTRWIPKNVFNDTPAPSGDVRQRLLNTVFGQSGGRISCDFDSYVNTPGRHEGIDMVLRNGAEIHAIASGVVTKAGGDRINTVAIYDSANNKTVVYLHMSNIYVRQGQEIGKGTIIGTQGSVGASASHIHLEVRDGKRTAAAKSVNDSRLDNSNPYPYLERVL